MGYTITDHLGSIWALVDENGGFIEKYSYDPWGRRINPDDWSLVDNRTTFVTDRGFTLHEHYDAMQIINMVARLYDPLLGQFISVDPMADKYPGWGAYVYCMNNPLEYWDPNGEEVWIVDPNDPDIEYQLMEDGTLQDEDGNVLSEEDITELDDFFQDVLDAANYLFENGIGGNLMSAINSSDHIKLERDDFNSQSRNDGSVSWAPNVGILTFTAENVFRIPTILPPCVSLEHEFDHRMNSINKEKDPNKRIPEEHRVISGTETNAARALNLIGKDEEIVTNYSNRYSRFSIGTMGPTSNKYSSKETKKIIDNYESQGRTTDVYKHYKIIK